VARPGETTAFVGSTGSGKSTVVNLIPRFYDVTEGAVLMDGVDIREVTQRDLRDKIGYVPQKGILFSGTIESNLRYSDEYASEETLQEALTVAQASQFVNERPEGLATEISQGGSNVSGGQRQRLSIARALVKKPPVFIFDDTFSALDFKTDAALRRALRRSAGSSTILMVTQRVATVKHAEQIVVLDEGRVVGKGTHRELMASCETYREIALSQLSAEELVA
jgi:ATP-binding cassette, subfamily B, multidrug efflux pump